jgi:hypothetical protein
MTDIDDMKMIFSMFNEINSRLRNIQNSLDNKLKVNQIIDITDDKVHMVKQIVKMYETPNGVMIHVR